MKKEILNLFKKYRLYRPVKALFYYFSSFGRKTDIKKIRETGQAEMPEAVIFEPTFRCNLDCRMCYQREERAAQKIEVSLNQSMQIFSDLKKQINFKEISLIGSEIFMRQDLFEIIGFFEQLKIKTYLSTNGTLINQKNIGALRKLGNITGFGYSLDGPKELHNKIRGRGYAFDNLIEAIDLTKDSFSVTVNTVIMDENIDQLEQTVQLLRSHGVYNYALQFEMFSTKKELAMSQEILQIQESDFAVEVKENDRYGFGPEKILDILSKIKKLGLNVVMQPRLFDRYPSYYLEGTMREKLSVNCKYLNTLRIDPQGEVIFCPFIKKSFGNLLKNRLDEIWNNEQFMDFRRRLLSANLVPVCKRCCRLGLNK